MTAGASTIGRAAPVAALVSVLALAAAPAGADDWPEFRGPTGQGHAPDAGVPLTWSETENVTWKVPVPGLGWSSPVVADGRIWLTSAVTDPVTGSSLRLLAYDAATGDRTLDAEVFGSSEVYPLNPKNSLASPTAVADPDGERIYVHFGATGTAAVATDGGIVWRTRFPYISQHGNGGSPILHDGRLILSIDGYDTAFLVAVDAATGEERWRNMRPDPVSQAYSTPLTIRVGDREQIVGVSAFRTTGHDPATGEEIWRVRYPNGFSNVPRPVHGHGMVYVSTGFQTPVLLAVRTDGTGDVTRSHIAWRLRRGAPLTPSPILVGDELYVVTDFGIATCVDAHTGDIHWQQRLGGNHSASPVFVDGRIYFQNEEGITTVIAPGTEFRELARNRLDGVTLASMAVSDGALFVRTDTHLYRIEEQP
ncbi:MAG: PQQ-binding-like beta-propeller repeat protein [Acidobacteria bacterium]|nr:PQQ-binding-like beta-propeller repeat protein [Acidobacteriota bacterium]